MKTRLSFHFFVVLSLLLASLPGQIAHVVAAPLTEGMKPPRPEQAASVPVESLSVGWYHSCGLKSDGTIVCWGNNNYGQSAPPTGTFTQVSAGMYHTCALKSDGTLACWGRNSQGQSTSPSGTFTQVSAGGSHSCGLRSDGTLACWGNNAAGQSMPPSGTFTQVSAGDVHTCGLRSDGTLACWGDNSNFQSSPVPTGTFTQVSAGDWHTCGLKSDGTLACWGWNAWGQSNPPIGTFTQISAGSGHTCGLKSDGILACWGDNTHGQSNPPAGTFTQVSSGLYHTCGLKSDGTLDCWGAGTTNTGVNPEYGQSIPPGGALFGRIQVSAGYDHFCWLKSDGTLACLGWNRDGQSNPPTGIFTQVSAGTYNTCGLKSDGTIVCWGANYDGVNTPPGGTYTQVALRTESACGIKSDGSVVCWGNNSSYYTLPAGTYTQVSAGNYNFCGVKSDGTLACVGNNTNGQSTPPVGTFTQVSAGGDHTCGLRSDGTLICWGNLGYGLYTPPTGTFTQISALFGDHICGLRSDGTLACWGQSMFGQSGPPAGTFTQVSVGNWYSCGLRSDGTLVCWGESPYTYSISGNAGVSGATLWYTDGHLQPVWSDSSGNYTVKVSYGWSGTITPSMDGYTFSPVNRSYTNVLADQTGQDYIATPITYTISGNAGVSGVTLSYHDGTDKTTTSGKFGSYSFTVSYKWTGTVTPTKTGYTFSPVNRSYTNVLADQTGQDYIATPITYTISGNAGDRGVTLSYHDGIDKTVLSGEDGSYSFIVSYSWSGTVTPTKTGYIFKPHYRNYTNVLANQTAENYEEKGITYTISGNAGVALATLSYTDGSPITATADGSGNYSLAVSYNWSGTVTPSKAGYTFSPANRPYTNVLANQTNQNYTATTYQIFLPLVIR